MDVKKGDLIFYFFRYYEIVECQESVKEGKSGDVVNIAIKNIEDKYFFEKNCSYSFPKTDPWDSEPRPTIFRINSKDLILYTHWKLLSPRFWELLENN